MTDAGCTVVVYEQDTLVNLYTDRGDPLDVIGVCIEPNTLTLELHANALHERYNPLTVEVLIQADPEDKAEVNEPRLVKTLAVLKQVVIRIIASGLFKAQKPYVAYKVRERKYDANVIGWGIGLDLYYLRNETRVPCL